MGWRLTFGWRDWQPVCFWYHHLYGTVMILQRWLPQKPHSDTHTHTHTHTHLFVLSHTRARACIHTCIQNTLFPTTKQLHPNKHPKHTTGGKAKLLDTFQSTPSLPWPLKAKYLTVPWRIERPIFCRISKNPVWSSEAWLDQSEGRGWLQQLHSLQKTRDGHRQSFILPFRPPATWFIHSFFSRSLPPSTFLAIL